MKLVKFNRAMAPYVAGETRLVPDDVAERLATEGAIEADPQAWPPGAKPAVPAAEAKPEQARRSRFSRGRDLLNQTYLTK